MLSLTAATCKQCRKSTYKLKTKNSNLCAFALKSRSNRTLKPTSKAMLGNWNVQIYARLFTTTALTKNSEKNNYGYDSVLSAALDQSNALIAQTLTDNALALLKRGKAELAWECYKDLVSQKNQRYLTRDQYNTLVNRFSRQKNTALVFESVLTLVEDMKGLGYVVGRKERLMMIKLLGQNGMVKETERMFEDLKKDNLLIVPDKIQTRKAFNTMMSVYEDQRKVLGNETVAKKLMELYQDMLDYNIQPTALNTSLLLERIRSAGFSHSMIQELFEWIQPKLTETNSLLDPALCDGLVYYFSNAGKPDYALTVNDFMTKNNIPRGLHSMTALIHKIGRAGDIQRSMQLFEEMVDLEGHEPTIVTYNALIDIHAHKKPEPDIEGANAMYDLLRDAKHNPDIYTFGALIDMFAKKGDMYMLRRVYEYMKRRKNMKVNEYIASSIVECFLKLGDTDYAFKSLLYFRSNGVKTKVVWNIIFRDLVNTGQLKQAYSLLSTITTDLGPSTASFLPLLNYYAYKGDIKGTYKIASLLPKSKMPITSKVYLALLKSYAKVRDTIKAEQIFDEYKANFSPDIFAYNSLLYAYAKNNEMEKVFETYSRISEANIKPNEGTFGILMYFYSRRLDVDAVESIMSQMGQLGIPPSTICRTILMQTYFECNRPTNAKSVMEQMIQDNATLSAQTWSIFVNGCSKSDDLEFANSVLQQAIEKSEGSSVLRRNLLQNAYSKYTFNEKPYEIAIPLTVEDLFSKVDETSRLENNVLSAYLFSPLIDAHSKKGDFSHAKKIFNDMVKHDVEVTTPTYVILMDLFQKEKRYDIVEVMWNAIHDQDNYKETLENIDPEIPCIPVPQRKYDYVNLLHVSQDDTVEIRNFPEGATPEQSSNFALSIYMDSLIDQSRSQELNTLWERLSNEGYNFDEHNWNRYIVSLLADGLLREACSLVSENFLDSNLDEQNEVIIQKKTIKKFQRSRDKVNVDTSNKIHDRTCFAFATLFEISGKENMGVLQLRTLVIDKIKRELAKNDRQTL